VYTRNVTGTSGATFDLVEETAWTEVVAGSALPYTQYFNNTSDWTLNGAYYEQTVLAATHGYGTDIATINFYELVGADYVSVVVDEVIVNATGDVTFRVPVSPAGRFPGKVVI
jgi:phosphoribosylaminoimidazole (AIR) synthetase